MSAALSFQLLPLTPLATPSYVDGDTQLHAVVSYGYESDGVVDAVLAAIHV